MLGPVAAGRSRLRTLRQTMSKEEPIANGPLLVASPEPSLGMSHATDACQHIHVLAVAKFALGGIRTYINYTYGHFNPEEFRFSFVLAHRKGESDLIPRHLSGFEVDVRETEESNRELLRAIREVLGKSNVSIIHSQGLTSGILAILANWRGRVPHVITHHDVFREDQFAGPRGRLKARAMSAVLSRASLVVCVSEDARQNFRKFLPSFPEDKLTVIPNGIDTAPFIEAAERRRSLFRDGSRSGAPFTFGFLGRFMPQKGFDVLIDAVAEMVRDGADSRSFRVLAVNSVEDCIGRYKRKIAQLGLGDFFEFSEFRVSVAGLLAELDAVVIPSRWEAGPLVPMEVLTAGCPLIASDCIGLREVVRGTPALLARAEDADSLAQQMRTAMGHTAELRESFLDYSKSACERFDVRRTAVATEELLRQPAPTRRSR